MTKKDLERRNKFLLLQLKIISETIEEIFTEGLHDRENTAGKLGEIRFHAGAKHIKDEIKFIEHFNEEYNFHSPTMDVNEYLD